MECATGQGRRGIAAPSLTPRLAMAVALAAHVHGGALRRNSGEPFLLHDLEVARTAHAYGASEEEVVAAVLHDVIEDGGPHLAREIRHRLGEHVEKTVLGCTDSLDSPRPDWWTRKRTYVDSLRTASPSVKLVSGCDKIVNLRSILAEYEVFRDDLWARFSGGREGLLWYFAAVLDAIRDGAPPILITELEGLIAALTEIARSPVATPECL